MTGICRSEVEAADPAERPTERPTGLEVFGFLGESGAVAATENPCVAGSIPALPIPPLVSSPARFSPPEPVWTFRNSDGVVCPGRVRRAGADPSACTSLVQRNVRFPAQPPHLQRAAEKG